jgi:hypothetical protein
MPDEHKTEPIKVVDRRKFTPDGDLRAGVAEEEGQAPPPKAPEPPSPPPPPPSAAERAAPPEQPYGVDTPFERLVLSLTQTAMLQLGLVAVDPAQPLEPDLAGARDSIDMLGALMEKTKGNLSAREDRMLADTLAELRMAFVSVQQRLAFRR